MHFKKENETIKVLLETQNVYQEKNDCTCVNHSTRTK